MRASRLLLALAIAAAVDSSLPETSHGAAAQPVTVDCNAGTLILDTPGAYVLTTDVTNCGLDTAISIPASQVVLDLDGRTLDGSDQDGTIGIFVDGEKVTIRNGIVQDFGVGILFFGVKGVVDRMAVRSNMNDGMEILDGTVVSNSRFEINGGDGVEGGDGNVLRRNLFAANAGVGVRLDDGNTLVENTASGNSFGIAVDVENKLLRNVAAFNLVGGFETFDRNVFKNNTASSNGGDGIHVNAASGGGGDRISGNVVVGNGGTGLFMDGRDLVEKNKVIGNQTGVYLLSGVFKGNEVSGNAGPGLFTANTVVVKNTFTGNDVGIFVAPAADAVVLTGNVATANGEDGIFVGGMQRPEASQIVKNVLIGNAEQGIDLPDGLVVPGAGKNAARGNFRQPQCDAELCNE